ncbi:unnamed protein product [Timema podura]|uniref:Uncharacterized protein n=1 Tax=Timema podura TaxID=61482 RepID=A0ABN7PMY2_TIMPD|nr:unnamed protein product [Timema podura]
MIYKLEQEPDIANLPNDELLTPKGVDGTYISDGEYYLFWLKEVLWN